MLLDSFLLINSLPVDLLLQFLTGSDAIVHSGVSCSLFPSLNWWILQQPGLERGISVVWFIVSSCGEEWGVLQILSHTQGLNCLERIHDFGFSISHKGCAVLNQYSLIWPLLSQIDIFGGFRCPAILWIWLKMEALHIKGGNSLKISAAGLSEQFTHWCTKRVCTCTVLCSISFPVLPFGAGRKWELMKILLSKHFTF